ncbi:prolyl oligopeptidase family serine peptidase [Stygiolobus caldivivus]|uniref:prolyl oligopeptidase n=1 Tax=Stygiolobus caldivivus TaxID=2824673 RepID=A0A8D5U5G4_9CREN|nr:prolyl oligopeptidase family serine peptidase [Stygiolobus caldivivus]BCU69663.1 S9 family peptidase [Stygiolobus caldivivus]
MEDEFAYLEDLNDKRTEEFIKEENERTKKELAKKADEVYPHVLDNFKKPTVRQIFAFDDERAAVLIYGEKRLVMIGDNEIYSAQGDEVITEIWKVRGTKQLGVSIGKKGSDVTRTLILTEEGKIWKDLGELSYQPFYYNNELCYVKSYRDGAPPDGGEYPTERVFCGNDIVYGKELKPGELISVDSFGETLTLTKMKGWRYSELYIGESFDKLKKADEGEVIEVIDYKGGLVYLKNDSVVMGNIVIRFDHPVNSVAGGDGFVAASVIKDYSTPIQFYDFQGRKIGEEPHDHIIMMDGKGTTLFVLETSFTYSSKVTKRRVVNGVGAEEKLIEMEKEEVSVTDIYVKGDVLLHGYLVYKTLSPKAVIVLGYGGFRVSLLPTFPKGLKVLLDEGYALLVTNLRGGYENGEEWHKAGMLLNKKNVFRDFEQFLRVVKAMGGKTVAFGGSNGGLLVGAVLNETPHLIDCAVISHPVLDMLRYHKMYVGKYWLEEYGDPDDPKFRDYLLSYSPYHNLRKGLPKTFVHTGINDDRVHPAHALKYVARSRKIGNDVLLLVNDSGHSLSDPETEAREYSYVIAFIEECAK